MQQQFLLSYRRAMSSLNERYIAIIISGEHGSTVHVTSQHNKTSQAKRRWSSCREQHLGNRSIFQNDTCGYYPPPRFQKQTPPTSPWAPPFSIPAFQHLLLPCSFSPSNRGTRYPNHPLVCARRLLTACTAPTRSLPSLPGSRGIWAS